MLIISTGLMTMRALETADALHRDSVDVGVLHVPTLKPLDEAELDRFRLELRERFRSVAVPSE